MRTVTIDGIEYYGRNDIYGFGYEIMKKVPREDNPERFTYHCYFSHGERDVVSNILTKMIETKQLPDELPEQEPIVSHKVVVHETKHFTSYYKVDTREELEKVYRHILKEEYENDMYYNPYEDSGMKNTSGFKTREEIEALPDGDVKDVALKSWDRNEKYAKEHREDLRMWDELQKIVNEDWGKLGNVSNVLGHFESERVRTEDLTIVE